MGVQIFHGDCLEVLPTLAADSIDAIVTDPPYELKFMGKGWDGTGIAFQTETWRRVFRVLKPGAHLLAFGGTRTYHRMVCAIEDAGFEIRDQLAWVYGSGFPKSLDVSKAIDKAAGAKGKFGERKPNVHSRGDHVLNEGWRRPWMDDAEAVNNSGREYLPATDAAKQWAGFGTALKPSWEPICLARKPLIGTVAENVLQHGTGALNVDGCRVAGESVGERNNNVSLGSASGGIYGAAGGFVSSGSPLGRWPANLIHDGSEEVLAGFPETSSGEFVRGETARAEVGKHGIYGRFNGAPDGKDFGPANSGSAARFFYTAKADSDDRLGSKHPTVKPVDLIAYLCRLITPPKGVVLDPFAGSGTTGMACMREGFDCVLIEREDEYVADIRRRVDHVSGADAPLFATHKM